jgi:hypothetical protein
MNAPSEYPEDRELTRRLRNLDEHLDDVFAAELEDPRRSEAFRTELRRRVATPSQSQETIEVPAARTDPTELHRQPIMSRTTTPQSEHRTEPTSSAQRRVESELQSMAETTGFSLSAPSEARTQEPAAEPKSGPEQTGKVRLKNGARITGSSRDKLAADLKKKYEKGASIRALAESTGRSYGFIHRVLSEAGVHLRGRDRATRVKKK